MVAPEERLPFNQFDEEEDLSCDEKDVSNSKPFVPYLSHITDGCSIRYIDPTSCVPLHFSRGYSENAKKRLKVILNGGSTNGGNDGALTGMVSGPPTSIVVPLTGDLEVLLDSYLEKKYKNEEDRTSILHSKERS